MRRGDARASLQADFDFAFPQTVQEVYIDVETFEMRDRDDDQKTHQGPSAIYPSADDVSASA